MMNSITFSYTPTGSIYVMFQIYSGTSHFWIVNPNTLAIISSCKYGSSYFVNPNSIFAIIGT